MRELKGPRVRVWGAPRQTKIEVAGDWAQAVIRVFDPVARHWTVCFDITPAQRRYVLGRARAEASKLAK